MKEMEALKLYWLEEVTAAEPLDALATINRATTMTTAGGEALVGIQAFYRYAAAGVVDVIMPDVKWCGGLLELRKVAAMVEPPETFDKGHLTIRKRPGFGITLNEKIIRQFAR